MYGDPTTTPGGKAIPFHSSVRIKLGAGQKIENKEKEVIGIHVSAKTIKNKVAAPFRTANFEIHFGKGIREHEQVFDLLRKHGPEDIGDVEVSISGTGAWKNLTVSSIKTGKVLKEKKFYKADFNEVWNDPEYKGYIDDLLTACMVKTLEGSGDDIDIESFEEVRQISIDMEEILIDPEE